MQLLLAYRVPIAFIFLGFTPVTLKLQCRSPIPASKHQFQASPSQQSAAPAPASKPQPSPAQPSPAPAQPASLRPASPSQQAQPQPASLGLPARLQASNFGGRDCCQSGAIIRSPGHLPKLLGAKMSLNTIKIALFAFWRAFC